MSTFIPTESDVKPGFYKIPGIDHLVISRDGCVYSLKKQRVLSVCYRVGKNGYPSIRDSGKNRSLHRLVAAAFIEKPKHIKTRLVVNHLDGDKHNFKIENLEWCSISDNALHAYQTGLRGDNRPVLVKDLHNGNVDWFYSSAAAARSLGIANNTMTVNLKPDRRGKIMLGHYVVIHSGDEWPEIDESQIDVHRNGFPKNVIFKDVYSDKVWIFESLGEACRSLELKYNAIAMFLHRGGSGKQFRKYLIAYMDDPAAKTMCSNA